MIQYTCSACGVSAAVPEKAAGAKMPCFSCGQMIQVPTASSAAQPYKSATRTRTGSSHTSSSTAAAPPRSSSPAGNAAPPADASAGPLPQDTPRTPLLRRLATRNTLAVLVLAAVVGAGVYVWVYRARTANTVGKLAPPEKSTAPESTGPTRPTAPPTVRVVPAPPAAPPEPATPPAEDSEPSPPATPPEEPDPARGVEEQLSREKLRKLHNVHRAKEELVHLAHNAGLENYAQEHAFWMARNNMLEHSSLNVTGWNRNGENIAVGYENEQDVTTGWMNSPGHRKNIMESKYTHVGFGFALSAEGRIYYCAVFGG